MRYCVPVRNSNLVQPPEPRWVGISRKNFILFKFQFFMCTIRLVYTRKKGKKGSPACPKGQLIRLALDQIKRDKIERLE